jgi:hypothetical protein
VRAHYVIALTLALALFIASRTQRGQAVIASGVDAVMSNVRGIRNNNPGNIRHGSSAWLGKSATQSDSAFVQFSEMRYGVRAAAVLFRNYQKNYGLRSVEQLISRWAPSHENDTSNYVRYVSERIGASIVTLSNDEQLYAFLRAVFRMECGIAAEAIPDSTIKEGIALA